MLLHNTLVVEELPVAPTSGSVIGFSEYTTILLSDSYSALAASLLQQHESIQDLKRILNMSLQEYAETQADTDSINLYMLNNPDKTYEEVALSVAEEQLTILRVYAKEKMSRIKIDSGTISTKMIYKFSQTQNTKLVDGSLVPKLNVRPTGNKTVCSEGSVSGEIVIHFRVEDDKIIEI